MSETKDHSNRLPVPPKREEGVHNSPFRGSEGVDSLNQQVQRIGEKLQLILKQREILLKENGKLKEELSQLKEQQTGNTTRLEQLQQQVEILKASGGGLTGVDKKALEKRLSQYIREIDRCITLLGE